MSENFYPPYGVTAAALTQKIAELRAENLKLLALLEGVVHAFEEHVAIPDEACECWIAPPCSDCMRWRFARDAMADANTKLKQHNEVPT